MPVRIDRFARVLADFPDRCDLAAFNSDIALVSRHPASVDDRAIADYQVVHSSLLLRARAQVKDFFFDMLGGGIIYSDLARGVTGDTTVPHHTTLGHVPRRGLMQQASIVPHDRI